MPADGSLLWLRSPSHRNRHQNGRRRDWLESSNSSPHPCRHIESPRSDQALSLLLHTPIETSPQTNLLSTVCLARINRLDVVSSMLPPVRKARDRALAVWTRAVPEESIEDGSEVNEDAVEVDGSRFGSVVSSWFDLMRMAMANVQVHYHRSQDENADAAVSRELNEPVQTSNALSLGS
jgi:hypothetical protein